jgi:hypothetical protein
MDTASRLVVARVYPLVVVQACSLAVEAVYLSAERVYPLVVARVYPSAVVPVYPSAVVPVYPSAGAVCLLLEAVYPTAPPACWWDL